MQRLALLSSVAPRGLLVAACLVLGGGGAVAQIAAPDPLTPRLTTDPRNPPRFQPFSRPAQAQLTAPTIFTPPASGAGDTGFDSTNTRKLKGKAKPNNKTKERSEAQATAPGTAAPLKVSPYQKPAGKSGTGAYAAAPGNPPVELGPIRRPLKKRKAHTEPEDPYAPLGLRTGGITLYPAIELIGGYDTNPAHSPSGKGATLYTVAPELRAQSNWSRHELKGELRGSYTGYSPDETPTLSRPNLNGKVDGRIDVSKLTRIDLGSRVLVGTDNPGSPNLQAGLARLPIFATFGGSAGIGQKFNRFDLSLKGDAERTTYQQSTLTDGSTSGNAFRNYNQYGVIARAGYELLPG
ncbi:MAG: outer membrane beta-barrel protein, partial [Rhizobiales bacterium]|nr:outer membrane beta-barrel protein [Hyphomicrobiales bacterium]